MNRVTTTILIALAFVGMACNEKVPAGYVGVVLTPSGWNQTVYHAGLMTCYGRDRCHLVDVHENTHVLKFNVLCADRINLPTEIKIRTSLNPGKLDFQTVKSVATKVTPLTGEEEQAQGLSTPCMTIGEKNMFKVYGDPVTIAAAKEVIGVYATPDVSANRAEIAKQLDKRLREAFKNTPLKLYSVNITNFDFPESITKQQEELAAARIAKEKEEQLQAARKIKKQNEIDLAVMDYQEKMIEAAMVADYNEIVGASINNPGFLNYHYIKKIGDAAAGPNNTIFFLPSDSKGAMPYSGKDVAKIAQMKGFMEFMPDIPKKKVVVKGDPKYGIKDREIEVPDVVGADAMAQKKDAPKAKGQGASE